MTDLNIDVKTLRKYIEANPDILNAPKVGRKKGGKNEVKPIIATVEAEPEAIQEVSYSKAKAMGITTRKPRVMTEEQKAKMLETLAAGREKLKVMREQQKIVKVEESKVKKINLVKEANKPTKQILIKPKRKYHTKKQTQIETETETELDNSESEMESETTDVETKRVRKRVQKKMEVLDSVNNKLTSIQAQSNTYNRYGKLF